MTDNVAITAGTGTTIASDDIAGVQHQRVKVSLGPDGTAVDLNGDATGGAWAQGAVAHDAADTGNPLKIGGKAATGTPAAVANNDRVNAWLAANGQQAHFLVDAAGNGVAVITSADTVANQIVLGSASMGMVYNGTTWDRIRGDINRGQYVASHLDQLNISQTPTVTSGAYAASDAVGGLLTFANAARFSAGSGIVQAVTILCKTPALLPALELVLFNQTFSAMADNGTWSPTDADMLNCIGSIPISAWSDTTLNSIANRFGLGFPFTLTGTSLFGQLVTRTAVTLTSTTDIVIGIQVIRD